MLRFGFGLLFATAGLRGAETNLWPNPNVEADLNRDGTPDFWHRGGSDTSFVNGGRKVRRVALEK